MNIRALLVMAFAALAACLIFQSGKAKAKATPEVRRVSHTLPTARIQSPISTQAEPQSAGMRVRPALRASHPWVTYPNPGSIRTFEDPELQKAFEIYFSLIGDGKAAYPFHRSGFDTEFNSALALKQVLSPDYAHPESVTKEVTRATILAMTLLGRSRLPTADRRRQELRRALTSKIDRAEGSYERAMWREDLKLLNSETEPTPPNTVSRPINHEVNP